MSLKNPKTPAEGTAQVEAQLAALNHPLKAEVQAVRAIIKGVNRDITEQWKWNAPSFSYKGYLVTFNLWNKERVHLVFHNGAVLTDRTGFLEGDYPDRRMAYFADGADIQAKKPTLVRLIKQWIRLMDEK
jgi:hypothetical protein